MKELVDYDQNNYNNIIMVSNIKLAYRSPVSDTLPFSEKRPFH